MPSMIASATCSGGGDGEEVGEAGHPVGGNALAEEVGAYDRSGPDEGDVDRGLGQFGGQNLGVGVDGGLHRGAGG